MYSPCETQLLRCRGTRSRERRCAHAAFTLLEIILALVILSGALAVLGEIIQLANRSATDARAETQAQILAASLMDEIMAGVTPASEALREPLEVDDAVHWVYSLHLDPGDVEGVSLLEIVVEQDLEPAFNPVKYRLVRWLPDVAETDEQEEEAEAQAERQKRNQDSNAQSGGQGGGDSGGSGSERGGSGGGGTGGGQRSGGST